MRLDADFVVPEHSVSCPVSTPERRLLLAVLEDAVGAYQRHVAATDARSRAVFAEVDGWFASDESASLFSFVGICDALGMEPAYVRTGLSLWAARHRTSANDARVRYRVPFRRVNGTRHRPLGRVQGPPRSG